MSYGKVKDTFWTDKKVQSFSDDAKMLALYLLTGPHRNILGCMRIPDGYMMADLEWPSERLSDAIRMLCERQFICRDDEGWTLVLNQLRHDPIKVPNHARGAVAIAETVPKDSPVYQELVPRLTASLEAIGMTSLWHPKEIAIPEPSPLPAPAPAPAREGASPSALPLSSAGHAVSKPPEPPPVVVPSRFERLKADAEAEAKADPILAEAREILATFNRAVREVWDLPTDRMPDRRDLDDAKGWARSGITAELCLDVFGPVLTAKRDGPSETEPPTLLRYCAKAVRRALENRGVTGPAEPADPSREAAAQRYHADLEAWKRDNAHGNAGRPEPRLADYLAPKPAAAE